MFCFLPEKNSFRICSRISREILDKFWQKFYQFNLYGGQTFKVWYMLVLIIHMFYDHLGCFWEDLKIWILDKFLDLYFQFDFCAGRLIREYIRYLSTVFMKNKPFSIESEITWLEKFQTIYIFTWHYQIIDFSIRLVSHPPKKIISFTMDCSIFGGNILSTYLHKKY